MPDTTVAKGAVADGDLGCDGEATGLEVDQVHANNLQSQHRYMQVEAFAQIDVVQTNPLLSTTIQAA